MSAFIYDKALQAFLSAMSGFDMASATVKVALVQITGAGTPYTRTRGDRACHCDPAIPSGSRHKSK